MRPGLVALQCYQLAVSNNSLCRTRLVGTDIILLRQTTGDIEVELIEETY